MKIWKLYLYMLFYLSPFVDALNGFLILNNISSEGGIFSLGQLFRFVLTMFSFYFVKGRDLRIVCLFILFFLSVESLNLVIHQDMSAFIFGLIYSYKIIYIVLIFFSIKALLMYTTMIELIRSFCNGSLLYVLILLGAIVLGIDQPTYIEGAFGSKGLFASGNGLSIFLGVSSVIAYYYYLKDRNVRSFICFITLVLGTTIVGTKASIVFLLTAVFLMWYHAHFKVKFLIIVPFICLLLLFQEEIVSTFSTVFDVIIFRYERSDSLFAFLASSRDVFVVDAFENFNIEDFYVYRVLIGSGVFMSFRDFSSAGLVYDTLENDFFDLFFAYGLLGLLLYLVFILDGFVKLIRKKNIVLAFAWLAVVTYSMIAGHVIFNAMSNISLMFIYFIINYERESEKNSLLPSAK